ncbi:ATP-binding protein [Caldisericum exile]|uniref:ATP-binding protein n=1 Tax=Caldisericum exile (strain DSM 21853 / NBRC 104410 / AZM16c01) TaxID=511051 RepID=A0A7U6GG11_CALEA|nr:ATP-binding protein [Caldisericum exile]BAL81689.1 hypothetical protein CSE_15630 [Caldisericum exile AZM16c01]
MNTETLKEVIYTNEQYIKKWKGKIIERENIVFPKSIEKAIILYGVRRSGKTFILFNQFLKHVDKAIYIDFEDDRLNNFRMEDFEKLKSAAIELKPHLGSEKIHYYLDEIQNVKGFEKFVRRVVERENASVIVSGSLSKIRPEQISTTLRGRSWSIEILPFSFREYLKTQSIDFENIILIPEQRAILKRSFREFIAWGGFPEVILAKNEFEKKKILKEYFNAMFFKDLVEKYEMTNITLLELLLDKLFSSYSTRLSLTSIYKQYKDKMPLSKDSLYDYYKKILESMLIFEVRKFSESSYKRARNPAKIYLVDVGLAKDTTSQNIGKRMENVVFIELKRRGYDLYYFDEKRECDFIAVKDKELTPIQVTYEINDTNREREIEGIVEACKFLGVKKGLIITYDEEETFEIHDIEVEIIPIYKWLISLR